MPQTGAGLQSSDPNYLRAGLASWLSANSACFEFGVQLQAAGQGMVVEDATVEWSEKSSPFHAVADITIPPQVFESEEQLATCESLAYSPWHSLAEHAPAGGINRVRRAVYETISSLRHNLNGSAKP